jgi:hypothetical protein
VERDRDDTASPRERLRVCGEPVVDRRPLDGASGVCGDALSIAGNGHARPEWDQRRIDGDDAPTHRESGRGRAHERVAGRGDGERPRGRGACSRHGGRRCRSCPGLLDRDRLGALSAAACGCVETCDLPDLEALLGPQRRDVADALGTGGGKRRGRLGRIRLEEPKLSGTARQLGRESGELSARGAALVDRLAVQVSAPLECVETGDRILQRRRAQQDRDRVGLTSLVERAQPRCELALRFDEDAACDRDLVCDARTFALDLGRARVQRCELRARSREARVE